MLIYLLSTHDMYYLLVQGLHPLYPRLARCKTQNLLSLRQLRHLSTFHYNPFLQTSTVQNIGVSTVLRWGQVGPNEIPERLIRQQNTKKYHHQSHMYGTYEFHFNSILLKNIETVEIILRSLNSFSELTF